MNKLFRQHRWLTIVCIISVLIVVVYFITYTTPELFVGAGRLFDIITQIAIGYIINYVFFIVNVFLPQIQSEEKAFKMCELQIISLIEEINRLENIFSSFIKLNYGRIEYTTGTIYYKYPSSDGCSFINITNYLKSEYGVLSRYLNSITSNRYFHQLNVDIVELVNDIQYSDFLGYLNRFSYHNGDLPGVIFGHNKYSAVLSDAYVMFLDSFHRLKDMFCDKSTKQDPFIVLEGKPKDEYIAFIEEHRMKHNKPRENSEVYVENKRIY